MSEPCVTTYEGETDIGPMLRRRRQQKGLGLREAARIAGVAPSNLSAYETGYRTVTARRASEILTAWGYKCRPWVAVLFEE